MGLASLVRKGRWEITYLLHGYLGSIWVICWLVIAILFIHKKEPRVELGLIIWDHFESFELCNWNCLGMLISLKGFVCERMELVVCFFYNLSHRTIFNGKKLEELSASSKSLRPKHLALKAMIVSLINWTWLSVSVIRAAKFEQSSKVCYKVLYHIVTHAIKIIDLLWL